MIKSLLKYILGDKFFVNNEQLLKLNYIIIVLLYIFSVAMLPFLPKDLPMQYASDGSVNYTLPSIIGVWVVPSVLLLVNISLKKQNKINIINTLVLLFVSIVVAYMYIKVV